MTENTSENRDARSGREISNRDDIMVGRPLSRNTLRSVEVGYLANCNATRCQWQGLFPDAEIALSAVKNHYHNEAGSGHWYSAQWRYSVTELVDAETAYTLHESEIGTDGEIREWEFPRTTQDVSDLVERGDRITIPTDRPRKVYYVSKSRSLGLPTWTVTFVELDDDLTSDELRPGLKNELIARDGQIYTSFGEAPLSAPAFEIDGRADHQANIETFANRGEARAE